MIMTRLHTAITGNWQKQTGGGYGATWLMARPLQSPQQIDIYTPNIHVPGSYTIYAYVPVIDMPPTNALHH